MKSAKVYVAFPKFGLGNRLLLWAKAFAFAKNHQLELGVSRWWSFQPGTFIRKEKYKRLYWQYFIGEPVSKLLRFKIFIATATKDFSQQFGQAKGPTLYVFNKLVLGMDYFEEPKQYRQQIQLALNQMLHPKVKKRMAIVHPPEIGVHIRRGDFLKGSTITPLSFFIDVIKAVRAVTGKELHVTIFSDATKEELAPLFELANVQLSHGKTDIEELLQLSQSRVMVLSIGSTFSYFAAFLAEGIVLKHPDDWQPDIRPLEINDNMYEGKIIPDDLGKNDRLKLQLRAMFLKEKNLEVI